MPETHDRTRWVAIVAGILWIALTMHAAVQPGPSDPGPRRGPPGPGGAIATLTADEQKFFQAGQTIFSETQSVLGERPRTEPGLGPRFNLDSCAGCHAFPAAGGSSPALNPQIAAGRRYGATNRIPYFITLNGPVREARFKYADPPANATRDGNVHALFTIAGRRDAPGCRTEDLPQPDFEQALRQNNVAFRIPTPVFGAGLIESIPDESILLNIKQPPVMNVRGRANREHQAGTITRFGWKAQNASLLMFAAEAYSVEQGVSNELFPQQHRNSACTFGSDPEDHTRYDATQPQNVSSDIVALADFMRFLAPPRPVASYGNVSPASIVRGAELFKAVGCDLCHTPVMRTGASPAAALSRAAADLFSDLLLHHMGAGLADDIVQGDAGSDEFRTAPLWGLGERLFFLHDGRTSSLVEAIQAHSSSGSEANPVISNFNGRSIADRQAILDFLRSL